MPDKEAAPPFVVRGTIGPADWLRAWRHAQRRRFRVFRILGLLVLVLFVAVSGATGRVQVLVLTLGLLLATVPVWATSVATRTIRRNRALHGSLVLTFTEEGLHARKGAAPGQHRDWSLFREFEESAHDLMLLSGRSRVVSVPKRLFESTAQLDEVRRLLARKVGPPQPARPGTQTSP